MKAHWRVTIGLLLVTVPRGRGAGMARVGGGIAGWKRRTGLRIVFKKWQGCLTSSHK